MKNLTKIFTFSLVYLILYNLPLIKFKYHDFFNYSTFTEITIIIPALFLVFSITFLLPKIFSSIFAIFLFIIGSIATYFLINFGKTLDTGVVIDFLSVEPELISEYVSLQLAYFLLISCLIPIIIEYIFSKYNIKISHKFIIIFELACLSFFLVSNFSHKSKYKVMMLLDHPPIKHFHVAYEFLTRYRLHINKTNIKNDLTNNNKVEFNQEDKNPLTIVLVIGESMRGDINTLNGYKDYNNMPFMSIRSNLVSFPGTKSSATSTRNAIPYMLTNATPPNFDTALSTKGIISIFKYLGFKTSWIGNQGLFGVYDSHYASNALESDYIISKNELRIHLNQQVTYDESLVPYLKDRLETSNNNNFIVIHLIGSHWHFDSRYPESFGHRFTPICTSRGVSDCTQEELLNSYHNTIIYTDYVLNLILKELENKNALLLYASDHGFSLNENGIFGNAYDGPNIPKEQLDITMFAWMSDEFSQNHKSAYKNMLKHKNISHDYIFHSLLDCIGVKANFIDQALSICK